MQTIPTHWHTVVNVNVSGYSPQSDDLLSFDTFAGALDALRDDISGELDSEESPERIAELTQVQDTIDALTGAGPGNGTDFLAYTSTHADSDYDIPTAWQVIPCEETECEVPE